MISTIPASLLKKTVDASELPTPYCPISNIPVAVYQQIYQAIIDGEDPDDLNIKNLGSFPTFESAASALAASAVTTDTTPLFNGTINNIGFLMVQQIGTEGSAKVVYQYMFYENGIQIRKIVDNVPGEFIPVGGSDEALAARVDSLEFGLSELSKEVEGIFTNITTVQTSVEKEIADRTAADKALSDKIDAIEIPEVPTKVSELENDAKYQSDSEVDSRIQNVIGSAPEALDTLKELADSLGNDPDFAGTVTKELAKKANKTEVELKANQSDVDVQVNIINDKLDTKVELLPFGESRKTIQLANHDNLSGIGTDGEGYNLAMISKWDKADYGSPRLPINLNGSEDRPTYNDTKEIALVEDIEGITIPTKVSELENDSDFQDDEQVDAKIQAAIDIQTGTINEKFSNVDSSLGSLETLISEETEARGLADTKLQEDLMKAVEGMVKHEDYKDKKIIVLSNAEQIVGQSNPDELEGKIEVNGKIPLIKLNEWNVIDAGSPMTQFNINTPKDVRPTVQESGQSGENAHKIAYLSDIESLEEKVDKSVQFSVLAEGRKIVTLDNAQLINARSNPDELENKVDVSGAISLIQLNKWNVVDIGSPITLTNINIPDGVRPTVQEKSQSGPNAHKIAYLDDIQKLEPTIDSLAALVQILNDKVEKLSKTDIEVVDGTDASLNDTTKDYVVVGDIAQTSSITAKSVTIKNSSISDNARLSINAGDVEVKGLAISGDFPKAQGGNAVVKINESDYIVFRDMTFNSNDVYNGIEIGLNSSKLPKYVLFDNCKFEGTFTNNPIIVFGTADDAIINIQNCSFDKVSNILRLSNKANTKCVVNISNCSVNQLDTNPEYTGAILCQDYTSKGEEVANNLFSPEKITINFKNFNVAGKELVMPTNVQDLFEGPDKMVYLYNDTEEVVPYEEGRFPKVNIF